MEKYYNKKMKFKKIKEQGYTLIELLAVFLIISILVIIALPKYFKVLERSYLAEAFLLVNHLERNIKYLTQRDAQGQGRAISDNLSLQGASWDEDGLIYSTKIHSIDISCEDLACIAHIYYPKSGGARYTLTISGKKGENILKTCQGPEHICPLLKDKGFAQL